MKSILDFLKTEPVRAMSILNALIVLAVAFGAHLSTPQIAAILGLATVILGVGGEIVRAQVSPNSVVEAALKLPEGSTLADAKKAVVKEQKAVDKVESDANKP